MSFWGHVPIGSQPMFAVLQFIINMYFIYLFLLDSRTRLCVFIEESEPGRSSLHTGARFFSVILNATNANLVACLLAAAVHGRCTNVSALLIHSRGARA